MQGQEHSVPLEVSRSFGLIGSASSFLGRGSAIRATRRAAKAASLEEAQEAFMEFWDRTYLRALAFARFRLPNVEAAEDLVHDTYLAMWDVVRSGIEDNSVDAIAEPRAYLYRSMRSAIADHYRRVARRPETISLDVLLKVEGGAIDDATNIASAGIRAAAVDSVAVKLDAQVQRDAVNTAYRSLSPDQREILQLRFQQDLTLKEISAILQEDVSTIKSRLYRSIAALKQSVEASDKN